MKNKKLTYLLIPLVLLLWGFIFYKIFIGTESSDDIDNYRCKPKKEISKNESSDSFVLKLNYPDPFLKNIRRGSNGQSGTSSAVKSQVKKQEKIQELIAWPAIQYNGLIKSMKEGKVLAIVKINGQSEFMKPGSVVNDIKLIQVYRDSIKVSYKKKNKTIIKN